MTSSKLVVYDPFREPDEEDLVKEVIGLANADVDGPRNILFGYNAGAMEGNGIVGIAETAMAELKKAHRLLSSLIDPVVHLAFIYDMINGKLVGTLEIDGCDEGPYIVGRDYSERLARGQSWIREGRDLRALERAELIQISTPGGATQPAKPTEKPSIEVGFNDDLECKLLEIAVPDSSNPPFAHDKWKVDKPLDLKEKIKETIGTVTTRILHLGRAPKPEPVVEPDDNIDQSQTDMFRQTGILFDNAENHYYFEEKALKLNLSVCNKGTQDLEDVSIEIGFPRLPDFDVADQLHISPFDKRQPHEIKNLRYPKVEHRDGSILVRSSLGALTPDRPEPAFKCALRLAVGPRMAGRKVGLQYKLRGRDKQTLDKGRLKIKFIKLPA